MVSPKLNLKEVELDELAEQFLKSKNDSIKDVNRLNLKIFQIFYKKGIKDFINEVKAQRERNKMSHRVERRRYAEEVANDFIEWLRNKGFSKKKIKEALTTIQDLLQFYELPLYFDFMKHPVFYKK